MEGFKGKSQIGWVEVTSENGVSWGETKDYADG